MAKHRTPHTIALNEADEERLQELLNRGCTIISIFKAGLIEAECSENIKPRKKAKEEGRG